MFNLMPYSHIRREMDPFREFEKLEREMFAHTRPFGFKTDIKDYEDRFILEAELPGFKKENISVEVQDGKLTITAERFDEEKNESSKDNGTLIHKERTHGVFVRSFDISSVDEASVSASYSDGMLVLTLPKKREEAPKTRKLDIQ